MTELSKHDDWWEPLGLPSTYISLRPAGDMGPSGADPQAQNRRQSAFQKLFASEVILKPNQNNFLVCHQVHSMKVVVLLVGQAPLLIAADWSLNGILEYSETVIPLANGTVAWEDLGVDLADWVGQIDADGLISDHPGLWIGITVADCLPILLRAGLPGGGQMRAALHSGWGGTGILSVALNFLASRNIENLSLQMGPCIAAADYPVPPERAELFRQRFGERAYRLCADGQPGLDLIAANLALLKNPACPANQSLLTSGNSLPWRNLADSAQISIETASTAKTPQFHSFRRDGNQNYGRMLAMIGPQQ